MLCFTLFVGEWFRLSLFAMHKLDSSEVGKSFDLLISVITDRDTLRYWYVMTLGGLVT